MKSTGEILESEGLGKVTSHISDQFLCAPLNMEGNAPSLYPSHRLEELLNGRNPVRLKIKIH